MTSTTPRARAAARRKGPTLEPEGPPALGTRILTRRQVAGLLDLAECIVAVEEAFRSHALGRSVPPGVLSAQVEGGAFHIKAAGLTVGWPYFAAKVNGNFYANTERFGLPRIQGLVVLCDARNGYPLAVMDSTEITRVRTGAATAVAARYLAREESRVVTICGCGLQGRIQLAALRCVLPIRMAYLCDTNPEAAGRLASEVADELDVEILAATDLSRGTRRSDVCVTCTPSRNPLLGVDDIAPGALVAAVGGDSEEKQELDPELLRRSRLVVDHLEQSAAIGELHHALDRGLLSRSDVHGELHEIVGGLRPGRTSPEEVFVFDSTGVALEDVATAALVFERAAAAGVGTVIEVLE
jgi:alanine dehydrogenase